jgi:hypothetical protein
VPTDSKGAFTYQIGIPQLVCLLIVFFDTVYVYLKKKMKEYQEFSILLIGVTFAMSVLMFYPTLIIWENTPFLNEINYPWTLLGPLGFLMSVLAGYLSYKKVFGFVIIIVIFAAAFMVLSNARPEYYIRRGESFYITNQATTTSSQELMPLWVQEKPSKHFEDKVEVVSGEGKISNVFYNSKKITFNYTSLSPSIVQINSIYYPGWRAFSDGGENAIFYDNKRGLMQLKLTEGNHNIRFIFTETTVRLISDIISAVGLFSLFLYIYRNKIFKIIKF